jgi:hypothetical protein
MNSRRTRRILDERNGGIRIPPPVQSGPYLEVGRTARARIHARSPSDTSESFRSEEDPARTYYYRFSSSYPPTRMHTGPNGSPVLSYETGVSQPRARDRQQRNPEYEARRRSGGRNVRFE